MDEKTILSSGGGSLPPTENGLPEGFTIQTTGVEGLKPNTVMIGTHPRCYHHDMTLFPVLLLKRVRPIQSIRPVCYRHYHHHLPVLPLHRGCDDDEIANLNKTIEILTGQLKSKDSEVQKKLVRVQEDIDALEGFSQQENAKLKHLLLNKEEEMSSLKARVICKEREVDELVEKVRSVENENERVKAQFQKVQSRVGGEEVEVGKAKELEALLEGAKLREMDLVKVVDGVRSKLSEVEKVHVVSVSRENALRRKIETMTVENAKLNIKVETVSKEKELLTREVEKYLSSSDPQITSHLTRVVATLLHLTEEETQTLVNTVESRSNQHLLSHIIK